MNGRKETINLKLYDIGERLYKKYTNKEPAPDWLISANQKFFQHEISQIQACDYSKVIIANPGNAQDKMAYTDTSIDTNKAVRIITLPIIQSHFSKNLKCEVVLDPFWMADIYAGDQAGESFKAVLKEMFQDSRNEHHTRAVQDHSQIVTLYVLSQRIATLNPDAKEIVIDYYHDTIPHLTALYLFFDHHQALLPKNVFLRLHQYDENKISTHLQVNIQGTGNIDPLYDWSARYLESQYHLSLERHANQRVINSANDLATYHFEGSYNAPDRKISIDINLDTFQADKFLLFRNKEIQANPNLASMNLLGNESKYTTAAKLCQAGLLPGKFVLDTGTVKNPSAAEKPGPEPKVEQKTEPKKEQKSDPVPISEPKPVVIDLTKVTAASIVEKQPAPTPANTGKNTLIKEAVVEADTGTSPAFQFIFEDKKFVPESPLVISPPKQPQPGDTTASVNISAAKPVPNESDHASPPTLPSKIEDISAPVYLPTDSKKFVLGVIESPGPAYAELRADGNDELIISPDDVYSTSTLAEDSNQNNQIAAKKIDLPSRLAENENNSGSDSEMLSGSEDLRAGSTPTKASIVNKRQNDGGDNVMEYLQNLYAQFENPKKNLSMTNYIRTLRNALQVHHLPIPNEFNPLHALKNIVRLPCWQNQGGSLTLFWGKVPDGISEIIKNDPATLKDLVKVVTESLEARSNSYFHGKRYPMTTDFYEMVQMMCQKDIDDQIRFIAINAFCTKWKISDSVMEVEIAPEFTFRA